MSDYLNNLTSATSQYTDSYSAATSALRDSLKTKDYSSATDEELMEACKSFEQYFIEQAMKGMEKMIPKDEEESSGTSYVEMFKDTLYQEYSEIASNQVTGNANQQGIGIAQMLFEQMKRNYSGLTAEDLATNAAASGATATDDEE